MNRISNMKITLLFILIVPCFGEYAYSQNTLQYYLMNAEQNSPLLQKQENDKKIIELDSKQFDAIYKSPNININSNVIFSPILNKDENTNKLEWVSSGSSNYIGYDLGITDGGLYQTFIAINQPLFTRKLSVAQQNNSTILHEKLLNSAQLTKAELKQTVTHQYILCVQAQKQKENILQIIQIIEEQVRQMHPLVNAGIYRLLDLKLLEIELENNQIEEERFNGVFLENFNTLNLLCGTNNTTLFHLDKTNLELNSPNVTSSLFSSTFQLDRLSLKAEQNVFDLQYLPQINAFGDAGLNATYQPTLNRMGFSIGLSLKWNLFDGHQKKINNEKINFKLLNIETDRKYFESQNDIRKRNILCQIENIDKQLLLIDKQLSEYNNLLDLYKTEIIESLISVLELKTLVKEMSTKQQVKINVLMAKEISINAYNYWNL